MVLKEWQRKQLHDIYNKKWRDTYLKVYRAPFNAIYLRRYAYRLGYLRGHITENEQLERRVRTTDRRWTNPREGETPRRKPFYEKLYSDDFKAFEKDNYKYLQVRMEEIARLKLPEDRLTATDDLLKSVMETSFELGMQAKARKEKR